jgi:hypothetical protein
VPLCHNHPGAGHIAQSRPLDPTQQLPGLPPGPGQPPSKNTGHYPQKLARRLLRGGHLSQGLRARKEAKIPRKPKSPSVTSQHCADTALGPPPALCPDPPVVTSLAPQLGYIPACWNQLQHHLPQAPQFLCSRASSCLPSGHSANTHHGSWHLIYHPHPTIRARELMQTPCRPRV